MKSFNSVLLCLVYGIVLVLGGVIFKYLEYYEEEIVDVTEPPEWTQLKGKRQARTHHTTAADFRINIGDRVLDFLSFYFLLYFPFLSGVKCILAFFFLMLAFLLPFFSFLSFILFISPFQNC